jgi:uncharacterized damage-inducible protein DinB
MTPKTIQKETLSNMLAGRWEQAGRKLATLAEEFPEARYESEPVTGARTVGDVLRHVAFWNHYVADSARGKKADDAANELPKDKYATKAKIVEALKRSTSDAAAALREHEGAMELQTAELAVTFIEHLSEHYGQLAVYARLNGLVPPASRG